MMAKNKQLIQFLLVIPQIESLQRRTQSIVFNWLKKVVPELGKIIQVLKRAKLDMTLLSFYYRPIQAVLFNQWTIINVEKAKIAKNNQARNEVKLY